jgi:His-Xaa-Ser system radical SAM maturase HxsC
MKLHSKIPGLSLPEPRVLRVVENAAAQIDKQSLALLARDSANISPEGYGLSFVKSPALAALPCLPEELNYLSEGDIIRVGTQGEIWVMYRKNSPHNSIFVTERCNSKCLMCSQPPRDVDDEYRIEQWLQAIPLMSPDTKDLGITGGEPTLYFDGLLKLISSARAHLPQTAVHMLTNGRTFSYFKWAERLARVEHPDLMLGIPLYSDVADKHDFVVQAQGAFNETIFGLMNLARMRQRIEIRCVVHQQTYERLPQLARFIARNLPFVEHVTFMGLEITGYTRSNLDALWIEPKEYHSQLTAAVEEMDCAGIRVSIYNHPLCLLPQNLWPYARQSISDWKNIYFEQCDGCEVKSQCGGFFASSRLKRSKHVTAVGEQSQDN